MKQSVAAMRSYTVTWLLTGTLVSCSTSRSGLFENRTPHEVYERKIESAGLQNSALAAAWFSAAQTALEQPVVVQLPYKETGYFAAEQPAASGYIFYLRRGEAVKVNISKDSLVSFQLFADLWERNKPGKPDVLKAADTVNYNIVYEATKDDSVILRVQPELLASGSFTVGIISMPTLAFPVPSENHPKIGSFWGDSRDAGARAHEGIDIFGKFRTPVVAAADGIITRVGENRLGGRVVFLRPSGKKYSLYYAHLDSQVAREGEMVKRGDVVGLMGNTGNAKNTPTHLHFGIYTNSGAIDPLPFVKKTSQQAGPVTASLQALNTWVRNKNVAAIYASPNQKHVIKKISSGTALRVTGATGNLYRVDLPEKEHGFIRSNMIINTETPIRTVKADTIFILRSNASNFAAAKKKINKGSPISVYGSYKDFYFIKSGSLTGWIRANQK